MIAYIVWPDVMTRCFIEIMKIQLCPYIKSNQINWKQVFSNLLVLLKCKQYDEFMV